MKRQWTPAVALFLFSVLIWLATITHNTLGFIAAKNARAVGLDLWAAIVWGLFLYSTARLYRVFGPLAAVSSAAQSRLQPLAYTGDQAQANPKAAVVLTGIGGCLLLLIVRLWIGTAVRAFGGLATGFSLLGLFSEGFAVLAGIAAYMLGQKNPKGVIVAKIFLAADAGYYLLALLNSMFDGSSQASDLMPPWVKPSGYLVASLLWLVYLARSKRVKNTYFAGLVKPMTEDEQMLPKDVAGLQ